MYHYVYLLRSESDPNKTYIGLTTDLKERLIMHNNGHGTKYTQQHKPWNLELFLGFKYRFKAVGFERYLKSGAGFAFANKRFWQQYL